MPSTNIKNNTIIKNTGLLYLRMLFSMVISLFTSRIILKTLGVVDFGLFNVIVSVISSFLFINMAMSAATQRFLTFELGKGDQVKLKQLFSTVLNLHIAIAILVFILAETIGLWFFYNYLNIPIDRLSSSLWVYQFSIFTALITITQIPYNASIISHEKMGVIAYFSIIEVSLNLILVYFLTLIAFDKLKIFAILVLILKFGITYGYRIYCKKTFIECQYKFYFNKELYKQLISYSGWNLFGNLSVVAKDQGVNILLNLFFGPAINASRAIAIQVQNTVNSFVQNIQISANPQIIKSYASNDKKYMLTLIFASSKFSYFFMFLISLPILLETNYILNLWLFEVPEHTQIFTFLILINVLIESLSGPLMTAFHATGNIKKYQIIVGCIVLINLPLSYLSLKLGYSPEITIYISILLSLIAFYVRLNLLKSLIHISFLSFFKNVLKRVFIVSTFSSIIPLLLLFILDFGFQRFLLVSISSISSILIFVYFFGLTKNEKLFIINKFKVNHK